MKLIEKNIPEGMKVRVYHQHTAHGKLDATVAVLFDVDTNATVGVGRALVNHRKEKSPSRRMGRAMAVGRAMADAFRKKLPVPTDITFEELDTEEQLVYTDPVIDWEKFAQLGHWA